MDRGFESHAGRCVCLRATKIPKLHVAPAEDGGGFLLALSPQLSLTLCSPEADWCPVQMGDVYADETGKPAP